MEWGGVEGATAGSGGQGGGQWEGRWSGALEDRDKLGALSSVFPFGKSLRLDTSPSGDPLALVSGSSGESLFTHPFLLGPYGKQVILLYHTAHLSLSTPSPLLNHTGDGDWLEELNGSHS